MKNGIAKTTTLIIFVAVTVGLIIGYETFRLTSVLKEKRQLSIQLVELTKQKASLGNDLSKKNSEFKVAKEKLEPLEEELSRLQDSLGEKALQQVKLQKQVLRAQTDAQYFKDKITKYKNKINDLNKSLKITRSDKSSLERANNKFQDELSIATNRYNRAQESRTINLAKQFNLFIKKALTAEELAKNIKEPIEF